MVLATLLFLAVGLVTGVIAVTLGIAGVDLWPASVVGLMTVLLLARVRSLEPGWLALATFSLAGFHLGWVMSHPWPDPDRTGARLMLAASVTWSAVIPIALILAFVRLRTVREAAWWTLALTIGALIAWLSGPGAGADPMRSWLVDAGIRPADADWVLVGFRKSAHFVGYGVLGLLVYLGSRSEGRKVAVTIAIVFALVHAVFDESRQVAVAGRTGSALDVLLDLAGVLTFLAFAGGFQRRDGAKSTGTMRA